MSPRAACRLEGMGFSDVYDYAAGKLDWLAAGLPAEGAESQRPSAGNVARRDAPTCRLDERLGDVAARVQEQGWDACVVVDPDHVVLGLLRSKELSGDQDKPVEDVMRPGPSTFRPHVGIAEMAKFMTEHELVTSPVTTSDGRLVGILRRDDAVDAARKQHAHGGRPVSRTVS